MSPCLGRVALVPRAVHPVHHPGRPVRVDPATDSAPLFVIRMVLGTVSMTVETTVAKPAFSDGQRGGFLNRSGCDCAKATAGGGQDGPSVGFARKFREINRD